MKAVTDGLLAEMVEAIVKEANPEKVILFGSHARGDTNMDSDIDLLIIEKEPFTRQRSRRMELSKIRRALSRFMVPKDILVYSSDEVAHWSNSLNHVISRSLREGKLLYERH